MEKGNQERGKMGVCWHVGMLNTVLNILNFVRLLGALGRHLSSEVQEQSATQVWSPEKKGEVWTGGEDLRVGCN